MQKYRPEDEDDRNRAHPTRHRLELSKAKTTTKRFRRLRNITIYLQQLRRWLTECPQPPEL